MKANYSANEEFNGGTLRIARECNYSLNDIETKLNNNVLVVGGSGTGKTRSIVIPNLKEAKGSYIISDPKGNLYNQYCEYLKEQGYSVKLINFLHPELSVHYNPMYNLRSSQDIMKLSSVLVNSKETAKSSADPYWDSMTTMLINAIIGYMCETDYPDRNFNSIIKLVQEGERPPKEGFKNSKLVKRFEKLHAENPDSWAYSQFQNVNNAPDKTFDTIRTTLAAKFSRLDTEQLRTMMAVNDFDFAEIGQKKTAVFVVVSDTDRSMDTLANIFFTQAIQELCRYADEETENQRLPVPVRFILDDFATNCKIDEFPRIISSIRSRAISVMLMLQSEAQLTKGYGEDAATITANCDTYVYLGGNDVNTAKKISIRCDMPLKQILYMPLGTCWVFRRGSQPVNSKTNDVNEYIPEKTDEMIIG